MTVFFFFFVWNYEPKIAKHFWFYEEDIDYNIVSNNNNIDNYVAMGRARGVRPPEKREWSCIHPFSFLNLFKLYKFCITYQVYINITCL